MREILLKWGWHEVDPDTTNKRKLNFVWAKTKDIKDEERRASLPQAKLTNHFLGNNLLENKAYLQKTLGRCQACSEMFYPRQYDMSSATDLSAFVKDYILCQAHSCKKNPVTSRVVNRCRKGVEPLVHCAHEWANLLQSKKGMVAPPKAAAKLKPFVADFYRSLEASSCGACAEISSSSNVEIAEVPEHQLSQPSLNGQANAWIVKDPCRNRGEGNVVFTRLKDILRESECRHKKTEKGAKLGWACVVQKYIEHPFTVPREYGPAKTDLRMWIMVLSWNPLTAFAYADVYFRVSDKPFDLAGKILHPSAHMTNVREEDNRVPASKLLAELGPEASATFASETWPQMLDIVRAVLLGSLQTVMIKEEDANHGAFELFGLDFALDKDMRPWLLEVNASPELLQTCEVAKIKRLGHEAVESMLAIALGHQDGSLRIPKYVDLQKRPGHEVDRKAKRLFTEQEIEKSHGRAKCYHCYGRSVASIPLCLVNGLNLGGASKKWRLILREPMQPIGGVQTKGAISRHGLSVEKYSGPEDLTAHHRVLRELLLPRKK